MEEFILVEEIKKDGFEIPEYSEKEAFELYHSHQSHYGMMDNLLWWSGKSLQEKMEDYTQMYEEDLIIKCKAQLRIPGLISAKIYSSFKLHNLNLLQKVNDDFEKFFKADKLFRFMVASQYHRLRLNIHEKNEMVKKYLNWTDFIKEKMEELYDEHVVLEAMYCTLHHIIIQTTEKRVCDVDLNTEYYHMSTTKVPEDFDKERMRQEIDTFTC